MTVSNMKCTIQRDIHKVWKTVTEVEDSAWRSDLSRTERLNENQFIEYTREGYATTFTVTVMKPYERWEFDMENSNMKGHWTGVFTDRGEETELDLTEYVTAKKFFMKPFIRSYLKKQQALYVNDLRKALT